jgi:isopentenyldiphosphate isomerase
VDARDELLDVVDESDRVVGQARRADVYGQALLHRCVFVLVRDPAGRVFVHRRTDTKLTFPGHYDMFVGGVVGAGESYDSAAVRESTEELGVPLVAVPVFRFRFLYRDPVLGGWWSAVYTLDHAGPVAPQESEIAWHTWLPPADLDTLPGPWVPDSTEAYNLLTTR